MSGILEMEAIRRGCLAMLALALAFIGTAADASAQAERQRCARAVPGHLVVYGDVATELALPHADLARMPRSRFEGRFHDGRPAVFEGVRLYEVLRRAGVSDRLRSGDLGRYVVIEAADGYSALLALAEIDPAYRGDAGPLLADLEQGRPLDARFGPVQVVVPGDERQGRWVRQVECLRLARDGGP